MGCVQQSASLNNNTEQSPPWPPFCCGPVVLWKSPSMLGSCCLVSFSAGAEGSLEVAMALLQRKEGTETLEGRIRHKLPHPSVHPLPPGLGPWNLGDTLHCTCMYVRVCAHMHRCHQSVHVRTCVCVCVWAGLPTVSRQISPLAGSCSLYAHCVEGAGTHLAT